MRMVSQVCSSNGNFKVFAHKKNSDNNNNNKIIIK